MRTREEKKSSVVMPIVLSPPMIPCTKSEAIIAPKHDASTRLPTVSPTHKTLIAITKSTADVSQSAPNNAYDTGESLGVRRRRPTTAAPHMANM